MCLTSEEIPKERVLERGERRINEEKRKKKGKKERKKERKGTEKKTRSGMLGERQIADDATYRGAKLSKSVSIAYVSHFILLLHSPTRCRRYKEGRKEVRSSD